MNCSLCKHGRMLPGTATLTLERGSTTLVIKEVPADVCNQCGYRLFSEDVGQRALRMLDDAVRRNVHVEVAQFRSADEHVPA